MDESYDGCGRGSAIIENDVSGHLNRVTDDMREN